MRLIATSDTHNQLDKIKLPPGDVLCITGDITFNGTFAEMCKFNYHLEEIRKVINFKKVILVEGNHDFYGQKNGIKALKELLPAVDYILQDSGVVIDGVSFYGSPHQPIFFDWAYNLPSKELIEKWKLIPKEVDVLLTHTPPLGKRDMTIRKEAVGCRHLLEAIKKRKVGINIFGHIHNGFGIDRTPDTIFVNSSTCDEKYRPVNPPIVIDIDKSKSISEWKIDYYKP